LRLRIRKDVLDLIDQRRRCGGVGFRGVAPACARLARGSWRAQVARDARGQHAGVPGIP
jgi:hypothetical protein